MTMDMIRRAADKASSADRVLRRVVAEIVDRLHHGHFEFSLTCEVIPHGRRRLVLHAGKSYQFVLAAEECTTDRISGDPHHADASDADWRTRSIPVNRERATGLTCSACG